MSYEGKAVISPIYTRAQTDLGQKLTVQLSAPRMELSRRRASCFD